MLFTGDKVSYSFTLINNGNVKLRVLEVVVAGLYNSALLSPLLCADTSSTESWPNGGNMTVGQEIRCSTFYTFDQQSVESGDVDAALVSQAANLPSKTTNFEKVLVSNTPETTLHVDTRRCTLPNKAGQCMQYWWTCSMNIYMPQAVVHVCLQV